MKIKIDMYISCKLEYFKNCTVEIVQIAKFMINYMHTNILKNCIEHFTQGCTNFCIMMYRTVCKM